MNNSFARQDERTRISWAGAPGWKRAALLELLAAVETSLTSLIHSASKCVIEGFAVAGVAYVGASPVHLLHPAQDARSVAVFRYRLGKNTMIVLTRDESQACDQSMRVEFERISNSLPMTIVEDGQQRQGKVIGPRSGQ